MVRNVLPLIYLSCISFVVAGNAYTGGTVPTHIPLAIASLRDLKRGGIMRDVDSVYSMGFNDVYVPIQKTSDINPRFLVSNNEKISRSTMMEFHQNQTTKIQEDSSYVPLLGEFFSETSNTIRRLWIPVTDPEDVDIIVHNMALSARKADCFCMVVPQSMVLSRDGKNDAITRYRALVHDGKMMMMGTRDSSQSLDIAARSQIQMVAFPSSLINVALVERAREISIQIGASNADDKSEIDRMIAIGVDFFVTKSPLHYMSATSKKKLTKKMRVHAAVMFGG